MASLESALSQNALYEKILTKYKALKKEKEELYSDFCRLQKDFESFKIKEQTKFSDLKTENSQLLKMIHELRSENKNYSTKLTLRDQEIKELNTRFDTKITIDEKNKARDVNLFSKLMGRKPIITNSQDSKFLTIISTYETQHEKSEKRIQEIEKELMSMRCGLPSPKNNNEGFPHKNSKNIQKNLMEKIEEITQEKRKMESELEILTENHNRLKIEMDKLTIRNEDLIKLLEKSKATNQGLHQKLSAHTESNKENVPANISNLKKKELSEECTPKKENSNLLLQRLCEIFAVKDYDELMVTVVKTEKVMKVVPKLEQMIMEICKIVLPKVGLDVTQANIDKLIPNLKQWSSNQDLFLDIVNFKNNLIEKLELKNNQATELDIYKAIDNMKISVNLNNEQKELLTEEKEKLYYENIMNQEKYSENMAAIYKIFDASNEEILLSKIQYIFFQFQELNRFINIGRKLLDLEEDIPNEMCLGHMLKVLERIKMNKKEDIDFLLKLENEFRVLDYDFIIKKIKQKLKATS